VRLRRPRPDEGGRSGAGRLAVPQQLQHPAGPRDASRDFLAGLEGVSDPEKKRKFIGAEFINVFEAEAKKIGGATSSHRARFTRT
jgi:hypothetical protein